MCSTIIVLCQDHIAQYFDCIYMYMYMRLSNVLKFAICMITWNHEDNIMKIDGGVNFFTTMHSKCLYMVVTLIGVNEIHMYMVECTAIKGMWLICLPMTPSCSGLPHDHLPLSIKTVVATQTYYCRKILCWWSQCTPM